jgi:thioredoxin-related protein
MKKLILVFSCSFIVLSGFAQSKLYDPNADAEKDLQKVIAEAKKSNKHVLIQGGGNWCSWCIEFARFAKAVPQVDSVINASFIWYHLNYSKENKNEKIFANYGYAQRFGFPVFIILDQDGKRIHTQSSEYLENGKKSYDTSKVRNFLEMWSPLALDPKQYEKKGK